MDAVSDKALAELYQELADETDSLELLCTGCGNCCHFDQADHTLFASALEKEYLLSHSAPPPNPDPDSDPAIANLIGIDCQARDGRPLGCRLYFCQDAGGGDDLLSPHYEKWTNRLKELHLRLGHDWDYRPLLPL